MVIWPAAASAQNNIAAVSADGSTVWVLIRRLNSSWSRSIALVVRALFHWLGGSRVKVKSRSPASSRLSATALHLSRHLRRKARRRASISANEGVDHVVVVGGDLVVQPLGRVGQQVALLVNGAALGWHIAPERGQRLFQPGSAVDNQQLWPAQPALDQIVENHAPSLAGLATHVLDGQQHLVAVLAHAEHDQKHDRGGLPVEPDPHYSPVQDQADDRCRGERAGIPGIPIAFHLSPYPTHRILADRTAKDRGERPAHPARVGSGQIGARDQRIGLLGSPLIGPQRRALPLGCPASVASSLARGTAISTRPKVPSSDRNRWPCRWPVTPLAPSAFSQASFRRRA